MWLRGRMTALWRGQAREVSRVPKRWVERVEGEGEERRDRREPEERREERRHKGVGGDRQQQP